MRCDDCCEELKINRPMKRKLANQSNGGIQIYGRAVAEKTFFKKRALAVLPNRILPLIQPSESPLFSSVYSTDSIEQSLIINGTKEKPETAENGSFYR
jgi:hypothetical protein